MDAVLGGLIFSVIFVALLRLKRASLFHAVAGIFVLYSLGIGAVLVYPIFLSVWAGVVRIFYYLESLDHRMIVIAFVIICLATIVICIPSGGKQDVP